MKQLIADKLLLIELVCRKAGFLQQIAVARPAPASAAFELAFLNAEMFREF